MPLKIQLELSEEDAACIWANATWDGKLPFTVEHILTEKAKEAAETYRRKFGAPAAARALASYQRQFPSEDTLYDTCAAVGHCPRATVESAPYHHFYWDAERDETRMEEIHGENGKGHDDPLSHYGAVVCKTCERKALVRSDSEDFPEI